MTTNNTPSNTSAATLKLDSNAKAIFSEMSDALNVDRSGYPAIAAASQTLADHYDREPYTPEWPEQFLSLAVKAGIWKTVPDRWSSKGEQTRVKHCALIAGAMPAIDAECKKHATTATQKIHNAGVDAKTKVQPSRVRQGAMTTIYNAIVKDDKKFTVKLRNSACAAAATKVQKSILDRHGMLSGHSIGVRAKACASSLAKLLNGTADVGALQIDQSARETLAKAQRILLGLAINDKALEADKAGTKALCVLVDPDDPDTALTTKACVEHVRQFDWVEGEIKEETEEETEAEDGDDGEDTEEDTISEKPLKKVKAKSKAKAKAKPSADADPEPAGFDMEGFAEAMGQNVAETMMQFMEK